MRHSGSKQAHQHPISIIAHTLLPADMIDQNDFLRIIELTPLVSIDLILKSNDDKYLLGKRLNRPAKNY